MKISFDFDGCLSINSIEVFASKCLEKGYDVWIITSRHHSFWSEVIEIADRLGIPHYKVIFTGGHDKYLFIKEVKCDFHIDDDWQAVGLINKFTSCFAISNFGNPNWENILINKLIEK